MSAETKNCQFCGEQILAIAIKCKHCGSLLDGSGPGPTGSKEILADVVANPFRRTATMNPKSSRPVLICACGLLGAFFMPWVQLFGVGLSGYNLGQLGSYGNYAWIIPLLAGATILLSFCGVDNRPFGALAGMVPLWALLYGLRRLSSESRPDATKGVLAIAQHLLSIGAYLTMIFSIAIIIAAFARPGITATPAVKPDAFPGTAPE